MKLKTYPMREILEKHRPGGHRELLDIATQLGQPGIHDGTNPASREDISQGPVELRFIVVPPRVLLDAAPWLEELYHGPFLDAAREFGGDTVVASQDPDNYPLINIHPVGQKYELHGDTNKPTGLYLLGPSDRTPKTGGALVVSTKGDVRGWDNLSRNCERFYPKVGELAIMDGYRITHGVEPSHDAPRTMLVCNFWTPEVPESSRGAGLVDYQQGSSSPRIT